MTAAVKINIEKKCLEILADAVDRAVGTGFVHASIVKAAETLGRSEYERAGKAFRMLSGHETRRVQATAVESAALFRDYGEYSDPAGDFGANPAYSDIRSKSTKLGLG